MENKTCYSETALNIISGDSTYNSYQWNSPCLSNPSSLYSLISILTLHPSFVHQKCLEQENFHTIIIGLKRQQTNSERISTRNHSSVCERWPGKLKFWIATCIVPDHSEDNLQKWTHSWWIGCDRMAKRGASKRDKWTEINGFRFSWLRISNWKRDWEELVKSRLP